MEKTAKFPIGIENFSEMRTDGYYYIDKTGLIRTLLETPAKVSLFTRPRRFGKTLNMSMLKHFFKVGCDPSLFDGLEISKEKEFCSKYMGKFPVIFITLKSVEGRNFEDAKSMLRWTIGKAAQEFYFLTKSSKLDELELQQYRALIQMNRQGIFTMENEYLKNSLQILSHLLYKHYGQRTILLIDEYDVPLDKAYQSGYYEEMVELIRGLFGQALKTNDSLYLAVLTGCLRISKESIFTGLNNFRVHTVKDVQYNEYFGFTDTEIRKIIADYNWPSAYNAIKEWYDGYHFGSLDIYCPWDVVNFCYTLKIEPSAKPQNYWVNTSSNGIIRKFAGMAKISDRNEIELLINGGCIKKKIHQELTYRDLDSNIDNLWSLLFTTGYLTQCGEDDEDGMTGLVIPNKEIHWIFVEQIRQWFQEETKKDSKKLESFCEAFEKNDTATIESGFSAYLKKAISIRDTNSRKDMKENFYHGILLGLFANMEGWDARSNAEAGEGYSDIIVEIEEKEIGIVIELKYAEHAAFDPACQAAAQQMKEKNYEQPLIDDGMNTIYRYAIACYKKRCKVLSV